MSSAPAGRWASAPCRCCRRAWPASLALRSPSTCRAVEVSRVPEARAHAGDTFAMTIVASPTSSDAMTLVIDAPAIAVMVCALFGGDPDLPVSPIERDLSQIEIDVATMVFQEVAQALNGSGRRSLDLRLPVPRAMSGSEAKRRVLRDGAAVRIVFGISTPTDSGTVTVMMPQRICWRPADSRCQCQRGRSECPTGGRAFRKR